MKAGDLVKFTGTWGPTVPDGERRTGIVMKVWTNGRTQRIQRADVLWDSSAVLQSPARLLQVINESR